MERFFVGTYTRLGGPGVAMGTREGDALSLITSADDVANPTYVIVSADGRTLYASAGYYENDEGCAASWRIEGDSLRFLGSTPTKGKASCHLVLSRDERFLYVANYLSGSVSVFPVEDGVIGPIIQLIEHEGHGSDAERQECAHAHQVVFRPGTESIFVCDLGIDAVMVYDRDPVTGRLTFSERIDGAGAGFGPRHLVFKDADTFYLAYELGSKVSLFKNGENGWKCVQTLATLPEDYEGFNGVAAIRLFEGDIYVSNRGHDSIARFRVLKDDFLEPVSITPSAGKFPRDFDFSKDGVLYMANQDAGGLTLTRDGKTVSDLPIKGAVCICIQKE